MNNKLKYTALILLSFSLLLFTGCQPKVPELPGTLPSITDIGSNTLTVNWDAVILKEGTVSYKVILTKHIDDYEWTKVEAGKSHSDKIFEIIMYNTNNRTSTVNQNTDALSVTFDNLDPETEYYAIVLAINYAANSYNIYPLAESRTLEVSGSESIGGEQRQPITPAGGINSAAYKNVRVYTEEDFANVQPIFDIDMVLIEGGSMEIQGKMVTLDSFYMNKYELTWQMARRAYIWGYEQGYLDEAYNSAENLINYNINLDAYSNSVRLCNYLSILDGYTPVYQKENREGPVVRAEDMYEVLSNRQGVIVGRPIPVFIDWEADDYRLPTEAEWEYAARGGKHSKGYTFSGSNNLDEVAWFDLYSGESNIESYIGVPVGQKKPNELGLYDMSGNAAEWTINPWQIGDMLIPEHNPGRIEQYNGDEYIIIRGGNIPTYTMSPPKDLSWYIPQTRIVSYIGNPDNYQSIEFDNITVERENTIRLTRSKFL